MMTVNTKCLYSVPRQGIALAQRGMNFAHGAYIPTNLPVLRGCATEASEIAYEVLRGV